MTTTTSQASSTVQWSVFTRLEGMARVVVFRTSGGGTMILPRDAVSRTDLARIETWARAADVTIKGRISIDEGM